MKLNFKTPLLNLDGSDTGDTLNKLLSTHLATASEVQDPVKFFDWAVKLHNDGEVELDNSDLDTLKNFIKTNRRMNVFTQGRLLEVFKSIKE